VIHSAAKTIRCYGKKIIFPEPVIQIAIEPKTKADQDKLSEALSKLSEEDPTFKLKLMTKQARRLSAVWENFTLKF